MSQGAMPDIDPVELQLLLATISNAGHALDLTPDELCAAVEGYLVGRITAMREAIVNGLNDATNVARSGTDFGTVATTVSTQVRALQSVEADFARRSIALATVQAARALIAQGGG